MATIEARAAPTEQMMGALHPVALTALLYLQEAVQEERYEACADLLAVAREFGAPELEIQGVLAEPRRRLTPGRSARLVEAR